MPIGFKKVLRKENGIFSRAFKLFSKTSHRQCSGERGDSHSGQTVDCPAAGSAKLTDLLQGNNNNSNNNSAVLGRNTIFFRQLSNQRRVLPCTYI